MGCRRGLTVGIVILAVGGFSFNQAASQDFFPPQTQAVEFSGKITDINERSQTITVRTDDGVVFAQVNPIRRLSNGQVIQGIPAARVRVMGWDTPEMLRKGNFIQFRAKIENRRQTIQPVREITLIASLPNPGFMSPPPDEDDEIEIDGFEGFDDQAFDDLGRLRNGRGVGEDNEVAPEMVEDLIVYAQIYSIKDDLLTVNVPVNRNRRRINVHLHENALVRIESDSLRNASVGDDIYVSGEALELPRFFATNVVVTHYTENAELRARTLAELNNAGDDAALAGAGGDNRDGADAGGLPADPFDIVRRERERREAEGEAADRADNRAADGGVYFGRLIRIN